jgi:hypothetical protein
MVLMVNVAHSSTIINNHFLILQTSACASRRGIFCLVINNTDTNDKTVETLGCVSYIMP